MTVDEDEEKDVTIEKAYDNYEEFGVAYEPRVKRKKVTYEEEVEMEMPEPEVDEEKKDTTSLDNLINDTNNASEEFTKMEDKIDDELEDKIDEVIKEPETEVLEDEVKEEIPSREESKKSTKVDADFFELIDSMYKERIDE